MTRIQLKFDEPWTKTAKTGVYGPISGAAELNGQR